MECQNLGFRSNHWSFYMNIIDAFGLKPFPECMDPVVSERMTRTKPIGRELFSEKDAGLAHEQVNAQLLLNIDFW
jgi:hypothetical protein